MKLNLRKYYLCAFSYGGMRLEFVFWGRDGSGLFLNRVLPLELGSETSVVACVRAVVGGWGEAPPPANCEGCELPAAGLCAPWERPESRPQESCPSRALSPKSPDPRCQMPPGYLHVAHAQPPQTQSVPVGGDCLLSRSGFLPGSSPLSRALLRSPHLPARKLHTTQVSSFSITPVTTEMSTFPAPSTGFAIQVQSVTYPSHVLVRSALLSPLHRRGN